MLCFCSLFSDIFNAYGIRFLFDVEAPYGMKEIYEEQ